MYSPPRREKTRRWETSFRPLFMPKQGEHVGRFWNWNITLGARAINARSTFHQFYKDQEPHSYNLEQESSCQEKPAQVSCWSWEQQHGQCKHITIRVWYCSEVGLNRRSLYFRRLSTVHAPTHIRWWYTSVHHHPTTRNREPHSYIHWWSNDAVVCLPTWCIISRRTINQRWFSLFITM